MEGFKNHINFTDPISLSEYNGTYWANEGKHRVCMAKRANIDWVWAKVNNLDDFEALRYLLLPSVRLEDTPIIEEVVNVADGKPVETNELVLIVRIPEPFIGGDGTKIKLDYKPFTDTWTLIDKKIGGIFYKKQNLTRKVPMIPFLKFLPWHRIEELTKISVKIEKNHCKTGVWLIKEITTYENGKDIRKETLYRYGCWREKHLEVYLK